MARRNAAFGEGSGPILLGSVACTGIEPSLFECPNSGLEAESCPHSQDAGVVCLPGTLTLHNNSKPKFCGK